MNFFKKLFKRKPKNKPLVVRDSTGYRFEIPVEAMSARHKQ